MSNEPITKELRESMTKYGWCDGDNVVFSNYQPGIESEPLLALRGSRFDALCDAIDAVHANLERENESLRRELDRVLGEEHDFAPESHYMMLPKDADGEPVHVGDVVEWCDSGDAIDVIGVGANDTLFYVDSDGDGEQAEWTTARNKRVRRADTWESIIKDAIGEGMARERGNKECCDHSSALSNADLVARCRALAGDAE
jgi:hypothetical protein